MSKGKRNYVAEYARRIARGVGEGLFEEPSPRPPKADRSRDRLKASREPIEDDRLQLALKVLRQEKSLTAAAREAKVSPERLRRYATEKNIIERRGRRWIVRQRAAATDAALFRWQGRSGGGRRLRVGVQGRTLHVRRERIPANQQSGRPSRVRGRERRGHLREDPRLRDPSQRSVSARIRSRSELRTHLPHRHLRRLNMDKRELNRERRRQRALERLGTNSPRCSFCGFDNPLALELHHIAGEAFDEKTAPVCRNCHRVLSDWQKDHPAASAIHPTIWSASDMRCWSSRHVRAFGQMAARTRNKAIRRR